QPSGLFTQRQKPLVKTTDLAMTRTGLNRAFSGSDQKMMAELALHGKFVQIQRPLFYRRMDAKTSTYLRSDDELRDFYVNEPGRVFELARFHHAWFLLGAVFRCGLSSAQRLKLFFLVLRNIAWMRPILFRELKAYAKARLGIAASNVRTTSEPRD
ncbi:MAG: hypothetical protein AAF384_15365, partial [Pseudomonadota bacterium]